MKLVIKFNSRSRMKFLVLILAFGLVTNSCSSRGKSTESFIMASSSTSQEDKEVENIEKLFYLKDREMFNLAVLRFAKDYPHSTFKLYVNLLTSRMLFNDNQLTQALELNDKIQKEAFNNNEKLYYEALFYSADIYEALGKLDNALAVLVECEKNGLKLNDRIRLFELPLKLSVSYSRLNQNNLSVNYVLKTESGLKEYLSKEYLSKKSLSEVYYELGSGTLSPSFFDYYTDANKFNLVFKYLIYCLNLNEAPYADKAKNYLFSQLKSLMSQVQPEAAPSTGDKIEDEKMRFNKLTSFSKLLNSMQILQPIGERQLTIHEKEFFAYLEEVQKKTFDDIYALYRYTPPTEESFRHQIFRDQLKLNDIDNLKQ